MVSVKLKGIIGAAAAALALISYVIYYFAFYNFDVRLDKLFFIGTSTSIFLFSGLLFTFFKNKVSKGLTLFCSIFYLILVITYIVQGVIFGSYYAHIKLSLIIGLFAGIIYLIYDSFNNRRSNGV